MAELIQFLPFTILMVLLWLRTPINPRSSRELLWLEKLLCLIKGQNR